MLLPDVAAELLTRKHADQEARQRAARSQDHEDGLAIKVRQRFFSVACCGSGTENTAVPEPQQLHD